MQDITKLIQVRETGVSVTIHRIHPVVTVDLNKKTIQGSVRSFVDKDSKDALKASRFLIPAPKIQDMEEQIITFVKENLDYMINGKEK